MKCLFQLNECLNFSTGKIAQSIGEAAMRHGWESYIAYSSREPLVPCNSKVIKVGNKIDPYIHYAENLLLDREGLSSRCATRKLVEQIKAIQPDIVQLHSLHDHWLNYKILFEYLNTTDIQVVWTFHDCWAMTGHCMHFVTKNCDRWKTGCHDCLMKGEYPKTMVDRSRKNWELKKSLFAGCKNLTIAACSDWIADFARESYLKDKRILTIHNGVDMQIFRPAEVSDGFKEFQAVSGGKFKIIAVSSPWYPAKGELDIYKLRTMLSEDEYEIIMVGLSADQMKNLPAGITGIQRTTNVQELAQLYSDADVLINPTYADTFPTVNLEALACGTPVITYKTGGSPEAIDDKTGLVIEQGNVTELANAIMWLRQNPLSSDDCRKRAEECFDKDKCFEKYVELYEELLKGK